MTFRLVSPDHHHNYTSPSTNTSIALGNDLKKVEESRQNESKILRFSLNSKKISFCAAEFFLSFSNKRKDPHFCLYVSILNKRTG